MKPAVVIMSSFAALWYVWGLSALDHVPIPALLPCLISAAMIASALRRPATPSAPNVGRTVAWASAAEGVALLVAANITTWTGTQNFFPCAAAAIVGLHFLPIARVLRHRPYLWTASALVAAGAATALIPDPKLRLLATGTAAAVILWATCANLLIRPRQTSPIPFIAPQL